MVDMSIFLQMINSQKLVLLDAFRVYYSASGHVFLRQDQLLYTWTYTTLPSCFMIHNDMLTIIISLLTCFVLFSSPATTLKIVSFATVFSSLVISLSDVFTSTVVMPKHWTFYIQGSVLPLSFCGTWSGSMCNVHITLQEPQVVVLMLCIMAFIYQVGLSPYI